LGGPKKQNRGGKEENKNFTPAKGCSGGGSGWEKAQKKKQELQGRRKWKGGRESQSKGEVLKNGRGEGDKKVEKPGAKT